MCIPASFVKQAADYVGNELKICTVIGFPNGYSTTAVKVFETEDAIRNGADEIDMVINIGWVKDQRWDEVLAEIKAIKASCQGRILKVIVETCLLTEAEKIKLCELVTESGADYIKTSTGFSTGGDKLESHDEDRVIQRCTLLQDLPATGSAPIAACITALLTSGVAALWFARLRSIPKKR